MSISLLWRWMDWIVRGDVILLGLMLVSVIGIAIHVAYRLSRRDRDLTDRRVRRQLAADLGVEVAVVRSIIVAAPYLGLVGACMWIMADAFIGVGMEKNAAMALISSLVALALTITVPGIFVAIVAMCVHNYLRRRMELYRAESCDDESRSGTDFRLARRLPLRARFSGPPAYALIAAPVLVGAVGMFMTFWSAYTVPRGLDVDLAPVRCEVGERRTLLHVTDGGELFLNEEDSAEATGRDLQATGRPND